MFRRFLETVLDYMVCVYLILILTLMPFFNRNGYHYIGTDKSYFFDSVCVYMGRILIPITVLYLGALLLHLKKGAWKALKETFSVTDLFAAGYCIALVISCLCSRYRQDCFWGADGWYMGLWPQLFLVLSYFFISKLWKPRKWILCLGLSASFVVFVLGYLNRFGVDPLHMDIGVSGFISTIGNINWYCGYLVSVFFAGMALLWQQGSRHPWKILLLSLYVMTGFATLVSQGSDSGVLTLGAVIVIMFWLSAPDQGRMKMFWLEMTLLGCACTVTYYARWAVSAKGGVYLNGLGNLLTEGKTPFIMTFASFLVLVLLSACIKRDRYPAKTFRVLARIIMIILSVFAAAFLILTVMETRSPGSIGPLSQYAVFHFNPSWGSSRGATWTAGWNCFREQNILKKLVGIGPDAMSFYLYQDGSTKLLEFVQTSFGSATLTNAHNEWLTILVNVGVLGLAAFAGMISTAIFRFISKAGRNPVVCACGMCVFAYTVNNIFSFQQAMNTATIFAILGIGSAFLRTQNQEQPPFQTAPH